MSGKPEQQFQLSPFPYSFPLSFDVERRYSRQESLRVSI
jgi:hypothetical protein